MLQLKEILNRSLRSYVSLGKFEGHSKSHTTFKMLLYAGKTIFFKDLFLVMSMHVYVNVGACLSQLCIVLDLPIAGVTTSSYKLTFVIIYK